MSLEAHKIVIRFSIEYLEEKNDGSSGSTSKVKRFLSTQEISMKPISFHHSCNSQLKKKNKENGGDEIGNFSQVKLQKRSTSLATGHLICFQLALSGYHWVTHKYTLCQMTSRTKLVIQTKHHIFNELKYTLQTPEKFSLVFKSLG